MNPDNLGYQKYNRKFSLEEIRRQVPPDGPTNKKFLCRYDLKYLCKELLGYRDWDTIHDKMVQFMWTTNKRRKLIMIPRGHLKSSVFTIGWCIQQILLNPNVRILISNVKWGNAKNFLHQIKEFLTGMSDLRNLFGDFKSGQWNRENVIVGQRTETKPEPTLQTCGIESEQTSQHYDIIIHDDIVARDNIATPEQREKVKNYYRDSMSLLEPEGICIVIGTPWHDDDLYQDLYHDEGFDRLSIPAFSKWNSADGVVHHDLIFPNKFSYKTLMSKKKEIGPYLFSAQYLLDPYPDEAQEFKKSWFQYYKELPEDKYFITTVLDPSLGKKTSNHAGLTTTGINKAGDVYILEARRFKRMVDLIPAEVLKTVKKFKVNAFGLERFGFQQMLEGPIRRAFEEAGVKTTVELLPYMSEKKEIRIQSLIPLFSAGKVFMKEDMDDLLEELMKFSPVRKHNTDDIIDSLSWHNIFWDRKPTPQTELREEYGSLNWWLKGRKKADIFWDFRKSNMKPAVLRFKHHSLS